MLRPTQLSVVSLIAMCAASHAHSASLTVPLNADSYDIYIGDVDNNGYQDFYFKAKPLFVLLHDDVATPLAIPQLDLVVKRSGNTYAAPVASTLTEAQVASRIQSNLLVSAQLSNDYVILSNTSLLVQGAGLPTVNTFTYDVLGRVTNATDTITGDRKYEYDPAGNRTKVSLGTPAP